MSGPARFLGVVVLMGGTFLAASGVLRSEAVGQQADTQRNPVYRSPNHVVVSPSGLRAYVVNQTSASVSVLDVRARTVVDDISVGPYPTHGTLSPNGRTLYVTTLRGHTVEAVDLRAKRVVGSIATGYEPYGVTVSSDGHRLFVANSLSDTLSVIDVHSGATLHEVPVERNPRFVAEIPGSSRVAVSSGLSRRTSIVDVAAGTVVESRDLGRANLMRGVAVSADGTLAFIAHVLSHDEIIPLQMERGFIHANGFSVLNLQRPGHRVTLLLDRLLDGAANPWGLALSSNGERLYASLSGVHEIAIIDLRKALTLVADAGPDDVARLEQDVEILDRQQIMRRVDAGGIGPRGIALSEATGELLVANYFSDTVSVLDAGTGEQRAVIALAPPQEMTLERKGEMLFNDARLCFQRWFSCASCHQEDATVDGLNWDLPNDGVGNAKNAKSLHDAHDTPPAMWGGVRKDMDAAVAAGQRFLGFLPQPENHAALLAFFSSENRPPNPYRRSDPGALTRGEQVFERARCHICHPAPRSTDLKKHDLGLATQTDLRSRFDTPSLREAYRTAPYLHDGRAATLREIFTEHNPQDLHGRTSGLTEQELEDLLAYVRSL